MLIIAVIVSMIVAAVLTIAVMAVAWTFGIVLNPYIVFVVMLLIVIIVALRS